MGAEAKDWVMTPAEALAWALQQIGAGPALRASDDAEATTDSPGTSRAGLSSVPGGVSAKSRSSQGTPGDGWESEETAPYCVVCGDETEACVCRVIR